MKTWFLILLAFAGLTAGLSLLAASGGIKGRPNHPPPPAPNPTPTLSGFGALIGGVTAQQKINWNAGRAQFQVPLTIAAGLGPIFNNISCFACHNQPDSNGAPIIGGASAQTELRFKTSSGIFDLLHVSSTNPNVCQDVVPFDAVLTTHRKSNQTFGLGLIEAIPDATILANVNRNNGKDGVFGRAAILTDPLTTLIASNQIFNGVPNRIGRFGWKAQLATTLSFAFDAEINELGETNRGFGVDFSPHQGGLEPPNNAARDAAEPLGITATTLQDTPADPSMPEGSNNTDDADRFTAFMQLNAPPPVLPLTASAIRGQAKFTQVNCVACHLPSMTTGQSKISDALSFKNVALYSDLLLHDMGTLSDGIVQGVANANEMRTAPLWGLRGRAPYLHDGRAPTVFDAIMAHTGEAAKIRQRFAQLPPTQQQDIINFLNSI
jgi:CxxC motif-containing protein (DUF1111 family)